MAVLPAHFVRQLDHRSGAQRLVADVLVGPPVNQGVLDIDDPGEERRFLQRLTMFLLPGQAQEEGVAILAAAAAEAGLPSGYQAMGGAV